MHFKTKATEVFPNAQWTGGSAIHASIARSGEAPLDFSKSRLVMKSLKESDVPAMVERVIRKNCPEMEWLMTSEDFSNLLLVDFYRLLKGQATMETKARLTNPTTGNKFHRISLVPEHDFVGGVRVWLMPMYNDYLQIGFRFRLESLYGESEHKKVRQKASEQVLELADDIKEISTVIEEELEPAVMVEAHIGKNFH